MSVTFSYCISSEIRHAREAEAQENEIISGIEPAPCPKMVITFALLTGTHGAHMFTVLSVNMGKARWGSWRYLLTCLGVLQSQRKNSNLHALKLVIMYKFSSLNS